MEFKPKNVGLAEFANIMKQNNALPDSGWRNQQAAANGISTVTGEPILSTLDLLAQNTQAYKEMPGRTIDALAGLAEFTWGLKGEAAKALAEMAPGIGDLISIIDGLRDAKKSIGEFSQGNLLKGTESAGWAGAGLLGGLPVIPMSGTIKKIIKGGSDAPLKSFDSLVVDARKAKQSLPPLMSEAKKYKSADEFVDSQTKKEIEKYILLEQNEGIDIGLRKEPVYDGKVKKYKIGDSVDQSFDWEDGDSTGVHLPYDGTSVTSLDVADVEAYGNAKEPIYVIKGKSEMEGNDVGESIFSNPEVIGIIDKFQFKEIWNKANKGL